MKQTILYTIAVYLLIAVIVVSCTPVDLENPTDPLDPDKGRLIVWKPLDSGFGEIAITLDKGGTIDHYKIMTELSGTPNCVGGNPYEADIKEYSQNNKIYILNATADNGLNWRKEIKFRDGYCDHLELTASNADLQSLACTYSLDGKWKRMNDAGTSGTKGIELLYINDTGYVTYSGPYTNYTVGTKKLCGFKNSDCTILNYISGYGYATHTIKFINGNNFIINDQILYKRIY